MPDMLRDGTGTGSLARVNTNNRLLTLSVVHTEEHIESIVNGNSYFANSADTADTLTIPDGFDGSILCIRNTTSDSSLVIQKIISSASASGLVMRILRNTVVGSVSNNNVHIPVNSNFGSSNTSSTDAYNWNEVGTTGIGGITGGTKWKTFSTGVGVTFYPIDGTIILTKDTSVTVSVANNTGSAIEFECGIRFYVDASEEE